MADASSLLDRARTARRQGQLGYARELYQRIVSDYPESPESSIAVEELANIASGAQQVGASSGGDDTRSDAGPEEAPSDVDLQVAEFYERLKVLTPYAFVTPTLVLINVGVFAVMIATGVDLFAPSIEDLMSWGANYAPQTTGGEWWRLFTSNYLHIGIVHIAFNMYVLWDAGRIVERLLGNVGFLIMYVLSGVFGAYTSVLWNPLVVSAGASGAVFGVYGCLIGFMLLSQGSIPNKVLTHIATGASVFVAYNIFYAIGDEGIDMAAHIGGLAVGFLCGIAMRSPLAAHSVNRRWAANGIVGGIGTGVIVLSIGIGLGHVADVQGAMRRFGEVEERVFALLDETVQRADAGELTVAQAAITIEQRVVAPLRAVRESFERMDDVPSEQRALVDDVVAYVNLTEEALLLLSEGIRTSNDGMVNRFAEMMQEAQQIIGASEIGQGVRIAAEQGDAEAQSILGGMYRDGIGVSQDYGEATRWFRMAAEQGFAEAQYNLGAAYALGEGVEQDYVEAYAWISTAAAQSFPGAAELIDVLRGDMTPSELETAVELAREYRRRFVPQ